MQGLEHEQVQEVESEPMSEQNADYSTQVERSVGASLKMKMKLLVIKRKVEIKRLSPK